MGSSRRAAVLGGGMAGIVAAAALRTVFDEVVVLEKDALPSAPAPRRGTPQAAQLHNVLSRGQRHLEALLPGFGDELLSTGGTRADVASQTHVWESGVLMPQRALGLSIWSAPRPLLEFVARSRLPAQGVSVRQETVVTGLTPLHAGGWRVHVDAGTEVTADLVVDATGVGSPVARWLTNASFPSPPVEEIAVKQWYATMTVERPRRHRGRPDFWMVFPTPPGTRGALLSPDGPERWAVSVSGRVGDPAPRSAEALYRYAATLEHPMIADALQGSTPCGAPVVYRRPVASWRRWDLVDPPIPGFVAIGDAVGALNPLFGQGVSVAAWQASALATAARTPPHAERWVQDYARAAAHACGAAWALQLLSDPVDPQTDLTAEDWDAITSRVRTDAAAHERYVGVWHLLEPVAVLRELARRPSATRST